MGMREERARRSTGGWLLGQGDTYNAPVGQLKAAAVVIDGIYLAVLDRLCKRGTGAFGVTR